MREYAHHQAQQFGVFEESLLVQRIHNWFIRRAVKRLDQLDDHLLADIGVTRDEIRWAAHLPLTENAALALEGRAGPRRTFGLAD
jgi:uncharacterized protein YjiS (DUF1127 family)